MECGGGCQICINNRSRCDCKTAVHNDMAGHTKEALEAAIASSCATMGVAKLKDKQREAIISFVEGNDVLVILPTGYGKSLCFALLPLVFDCLRGEVKASIVVCISPLTSLMMEQRTRFSHRGLSVEFLGELQTDPLSMRNVEEGEVQLLYVSPECILRNPRWREMLLSAVYQRKLAAIVVDEAHCIPQW